MGKIVEMMLEGHLCEECGVYMRNGAGFPQKCSYCAKADRIAHAHPAPIPRAHCPICNKKVKAIGLQNHMRDAHKD